MAHTKKWFAILGIALGITIMTMNFSLVNTALSSIQASLSATVLQLQWMVNIFGICISSSLLIMGRLADIYGHRRIFLIGVIAFGLGSLIGGLAPNAGWIIVAQALLGCAGAVILPVSQTLLCQLFSPQEQGKGIAIWAATLGVMLGIGPLIGGLIIDIWSWRWVFLINVPLAILSVFFVLSFVQKSQKSKHKETIDWQGAFILAVAIATLILGLGQGPDWGWTSLATISLLIISLISFIVLIFVEKRATHPIIPPVIFNSSFLLSSFCMFFLNAGIWAIFFLVPLYFQNILNYSPLKTGALMLLFTIPVALFSPLIDRFHNKLGSRSLMVIGFITLACSALIQTAFSANSSEGFIAIGCLTFGIAWLFIYGPSASSALFSLPRNYAGIAAGAFTTLQEIGGTVGLALTATFFRIGNANTFIDGLKAKGVTILESQREEILDYLTNASALAENLGQFITFNRDDFLFLFQTSFMKGYEDAMWLLFALALIGLIISFFLRKGKADLT